MQEKLLNRVDELINQGQEVIAKKRQKMLISWELGELGAVTGFRTASLSFIEKLFAKSHIYYSGFPDDSASLGTSDVERGIHILKAVKKELEDSHQRVDW